MVHVEFLQRFFPAWSIARRNYLIIIEGGGTNHAASLFTPEIWLGQAEIIIESIY